MEKQLFGAKEAEKIFFLTLRAFERREGRAGGLSQSPELERRPRRPSQSLEHERRARRSSQNGEFVRLN
jgi:hypothetical protein